MKKGIISMLCIALAVGTLTGCGSKKEDNRLVIWTNMNVEVDTLQEYADTWGEQNGYEVEVIHQSPSVQQFAQAVKSAEGPDAVVGIPNDQLADYVNADLTAEVPAELYNDADFSEAAVQACYVDGKRYAAPLSVETTALFYNTDMVEKVPATWEELVEQAVENGGALSSVMVKFVWPVSLSGFDWHVIFRPRPSSSRKTPSVSAPPPPSFEK